jgi:hypothetical protein
MDKNPKYNEEKLIKDYFIYYENIDNEEKSDKTFWAWEMVEDLVSENPIVGLDLTIKLLKRSKDEKTLAYVAAGPLENLFKCHWEKIKNKIEQIADKDEKIQLAISGVWLDKNDVVFPEWERLMKKYNFISENPKKSL